MSRTIVSTDGRGATQPTIDHHLPSPEVRVYMVKPDGSDEILSSPDGAVEVEVEVEVDDELALDGDAPDSDALDSDALDSAALDSDPMGETSVETEDPTPADATGSVETSAVLAPATRAELPPAPNGAGDGGLHADESASTDEADSNANSDAKPTILEMRQVAGLTAGSVMGLHQGSFQFREADKEIGFTLSVAGPDDVVVTAGSAASMVDEILVDEPTPIGDAVLHVGTACFTVRPPRAEPSGEARLKAVLAGRTPAKAIPVPVFEADQPAMKQRVSARFGSLFSSKLEESEPELDAQSWRFLESIRDVRTVVAERHRNLHPNPEELRSRLERLDPGLWDRSIEHPLFARFAVAYSTIPWEPRFDVPERIPVELHGPIQEMSYLPWVPITANLLFGPLGIVGSRPAVLACARNAVLSLAGLSAPSDIEFSIVTAEALVADWDWTSSLPNSMFPTDTGKYCVAVADGMTHFDGAGLDAEAIKNNEMGLIVLEETVDDLPDYCGTILQLTPEGECQVTNHLGEQIVGTPIGVTANFAAGAAAAIRDAVGDGPDPDAEPDEPDDTDEPAPAH